MEEKTTDQIQLVACCGLYCTQCGRYKKGKCPGCKEYHKATWCRIRACCLEKSFANCSECETFIDPKECGKYNNFPSRMIEFFGGTDRSRCIRFLREHSPELFVAMMNEKARMNLPKAKGRSPKQE